MFLSVTPRMGYLNGDVMNLEWQDLAFHREIGTLIDALDGPHFWARLTRVLERHVAVDA